MAGACTTQDNLGPRPAQVTPDRGDRAAPVPVRIQGRSFTPVVFSNYDDEAASKVNTTFSASLGDQELQGLQWSSSTELLALVPSGLAPGTYELRVVDPAGRSGTLERAFTVLASGDGGMGDGGAGDGPQGDMLASETGGPDLSGPADQGSTHDQGPTPDQAPPKDTGTLLPNGAVCTQATQCSSGDCVDGVCCNSACSGTCRACNIAGKKGSCTLVPAGQDPNSDCSKQAASTCGRTGRCDGKGACAKYRVGTQCAPGSRCMLAWVFSLKSCDGLGVCKDQSVKSCFPYDCNDTTYTCYTSCNTDSHCALLYGCNQASKTCYGSCTSDTQCKSSARCSNGNCWPN